VCEHGSWLNMTNMEFSTLGWQCLAYGIVPHDTLCRNLAALGRPAQGAQAKIT
jgi:hypothetical protein